MMEKPNLIEWIELFQRLVLRRNKIKSVDSALRFYLELFYIDFSHNK